MEENLKEKDSQEQTPPPQEVLPEQTTTPPPPPAEALPEQAEPTEPTKPTEPVEPAEPTEQAAQTQQTQQAARADQAEQAPQEAPPRQTAREALTEQAPPEPPPAARPQEPTPAETPQEPTPAKTPQASQPQQTPPPDKAAPRQNRVIITQRGVDIDVKVTPFPAPRLYRWTPTTEEDAPPFSHKIIITQDVLKRVNEHVQQQTSIEIGGFLLGNRCYCPTERMHYIRIDNYSEAQFTSADEVSLHIDYKTWQQLHEELDGKHEKSRLLGWYHSHPGHTVFLSPMDFNVHELGFTEEWMVALVIDPINGLGGFFCRRDGALYLHTRTEFYELKGIGSDETFMPWAEYKCLDVGTGEEVEPPKLSPLMKPPPPPPMALTRPDPATPVVVTPPPGDREEPKGKKDEARVKDEELREEKKEESLPPPPPPIWPLSGRSLVVAGLLTLFTVVLFLRPWVLWQRSGDVYDDGRNANLIAPLAAGTLTQDARPTPPAAAQTPQTVAANPRAIKAVDHEVNCDKEDGQCRATVYFTSAPAKLVATVGGQILPMAMDRKKDRPIAIVNISDTMAVKSLRNLKTKQGKKVKLSILFMNEDDSRERGEYPMSLNQNDIPPEPPKPQPEEASGGRQPKSRGGKSGGNDDRGPSQSNNTKNEGRKKSNVRTITPGGRTDP
jgi:proteasome lid subunit RPN8/RPN11